MNAKRTSGTNPTDMPLSEAVLRLLADASDESARLRHEYIGTEHLVLALSRPTGDTSPLVALSVEPKRVHTMIEETIGRGRAAVAPRINRPLTSRTKTAFSFAAESARALGHAHVGVADLVVGLMRERMNIGAQVLAGEGLTEERALEFARQSAAS
jgi:ATP-dependent Clp protease ATP-binding subunit ClpC